MCGNIGFTGREITKKLDTETIRKGGLEIIEMPTAQCKVASELEEITVEVGGYPSFINYNKFREAQHRDDKFNIHNSSPKGFYFNLKSFKGRLSKM